MKYLTDNLVCLNYGDDDIIPCDFDPNIEFSFVELGIYGY